MNGILLCLFINGNTAAANVMAIALGLGIILEAARHVASALVNIFTFLLPLGAWLWERATDRQYSDHPGEYGLTLMMFVVPSLAIAAVNLYLFLPPLRRWWQDEKSVGRT